MYGITDGEQDGGVVADDNLGDRPVRLARGTVEQLPQLLPAITSVSFEADLDLEEATDAVLMINTEGRITAVNGLAEALLGRSRAELVGEMIDTWIHCEADTRSRLGIPPRGVRFLSASRGVYMQQPNGERLGLDLTVCSDEGGNGIVLARPAVSRHRDSFREEEVAEIVHDLKSPLATIALEAQLLSQRRHDEGLHASQCARIERNIVYMDRLVQELLDLCAIDAGKLQLDRKPAELGDVLQHVLARVPAAERARIRVEAHGPVVVACDEARIQRVFANFVENALKYGHRGSEVTVRLTIAASCARVSVIDDGPGLTAQEAAGVFDKFKRASSSFGFAGSGLGLFVCRKIIEAHGGRIGVESMKGAGSRFYFELPVSARGGAKVEVARRVSRVRRYILIVDDERDQAEGLAELLHDEGYETAVALTAGQGMQLARTRRPDVVVADARLRGTSGVDMLFRLEAELGPFNSIVLTGLPPEDPHVASAVRRLGSVYVAKPVDIDRLVSVLQWT
jgi:signal transduction histidine kinase